MHKEVLYKHFLDCLLFFKNVDVKQNAKIIDVGTGAGFPGMVLKIARPDIELTLMDGLNKRLTFLNAVLEALNLEAKTIHMRAEDGGKNADYREKYDIACARAVANLPVLCEYCIPFVKMSGNFISYKSGEIEEEVNAAERAIKILGGQIKNVFKFDLLNQKRSFVTIEKIKTTPKTYPRKVGTPSKEPL